MTLDFPVWLTASHFLTILFISLLIRSGLEILSACPRLYLNDDCRPGSEVLTLSRRRLPREGLWTSTDMEDRWPAWLALPGGSRLGLGRHWHFDTARICRLHFLDREAEGRLDTRFLVGRGRNRGLRKQRQEHGRQ